MSLADRSGVPLTCSLFCFQGKPKHEPKTLKTRRSEYTGRWNVDSSGLGELTVDTFGHDLCTSKKKIA